MQNPPFKDKIEKEHQVVLNELSKFRNAWEAKTLHPDKIENYCNLVTYLSDLHATYVTNCIEYFTPVMHKQSANINKNLIDDAVKKLRHFQSPFAGNDSILKQTKQTCYLCASKIRKVDVKIIKEQLADEASLRRHLLQNIESENENENVNLFTKDEDEVFFNFLNRILVKKEEVLAMQTQEISDFLNEVTKSFSDLNFLTEYKPSKLGQSDYKQNYKEEMQKSIASSLKTGFNGKVHPWVVKVFESMRKQMTREKKKNSTEQWQQTQVQMDYVQKRSEYAVSSESRKELDQLKQEVSKSIATIDELNAEIEVLTKQKGELEGYYAKEVNELMLGKRNIEIQLKKMEIDLLNLKTAKNIEISQLHRKLAKERKKTEPNPNNDDSLTNANQTQPTDPVLNRLDEPPSQKEQTQNHFKKKKINLNKLLSKKLSIPNNFHQTDSGPLNSTTPNKNTLNSSSNLHELPADQFINPNATFPSNLSLSSPVQDPQNPNKSNPVTDLFLKEINLRKNKKNSKPVENSLSKSKESDESTLKFQINLDTAMSQNNKIEVISEESNDTQRDGNTFEVIGSAPKMGKQKLPKKKSQHSVKNFKRTQKRMLSIEMKIPPLIKASESTFKPKKSQLKFSESSQVFDTSPTKAAISQEKKLFEYVQLEAQEQECLKGKVNQITSRIELRNSEMIKKSMNSLKEVGSISDLGRAYGFSIFNKKFSQTVKGNDKNEAKSKNGVLNRSQDSKQSEKEDDQNNGEGQTIIIESKASYLKAKSTRNRGTSRKPQHADYSQQTEPGSTKNPGSLMQQISPRERKSLYNSLKQQMAIPAELTFHHYEMIVRKVFVDQKIEGINESNFVKSRVSTLNMNDEFSRKDKQKESVKINIDGNFFGDINSAKPQPHQTLRPSHYGVANHGKLLLNLPKLNHSPQVQLSNPRLYNTQNGFNPSPNLHEPPKNNKIMLHSLRQSKIQTNAQKMPESRKSVANHQMTDCTGVQKMEVIDEKTEKEINKYETLQGGLLAHLPQRIISEGDKSSHSPSGSKSKSQKASIHQVAVLQLSNPRLSHVFSPNDIKLFFGSELAAYEYEQVAKSQSQPSSQDSSAKLYQLTQSDYELVKSLYSVLNEIKQKNSEVYFKVCSFVKSPYQSVRSGFDFINTAKEVSLELWGKQLLGIYRMRKGESNKCSQNKENLVVNHKGHIQGDGMNFGQFLKPFEEKLVQLLILAQK